MSDSSVARNVDVDRTVVIAGPTASGKSALAVALAEAVGGVIINADSMQVYRDLSVLTARPTAADEARAPHRLYGILDADDPCTAGRWRAMALAEIGAARSAGRPAIVVGGTGLYLRVLLEGIAPVPPIPDEVRAETARLFARLGGPRFHALLAERDPVTAARLAAGDRQRLTRAWEVLEATGASLADWQALPPAEPGLDGAVTLLLTPPRDSLYRRTDGRFRAMVAAGAVDEVAALLARGPDPELPLMKACGVRELSRFIAGEIDLESAVVQGQRATRRYAKRQTTWFRHQLAGARIFATQELERLGREVLSFVLAILLTGTPGKD